MVNMEMSNFELIIIVCTKGRSLYGSLQNLNIIVCKQERAISEVLTSLKILTKDLSRAMAVRGSRTL